MSAHIVDSETIRLAAQWARENRTPPVCAACIEAAASDLGSIDHDGEPAPRVAEPGEVCTSAYHGEE